MYIFLQNDLKISSTHAHRIVHSCTSHRPFVHIASSTHAHRIVHSCTSPRPLMHAVSSSCTSHRHAHSCTSHRPLMHAASSTHAHHTVSSTHANRLVYSCTSAMLVSNWQGKSLAIDFTLVTSDRPSAHDASGAVSGNSGSSGNGQRSKERKAPTYVMRRAGTSCLLLPIRTVPSHGRT